MSSREQFKKMQPLLDAEPLVKQFENDTGLVFSRMEKWEAKFYYTKWLESRVESQQERIRELYVALSGARDALMDADAFTDHDYSRAVKSAEQALRNAKQEG